jgi:hypothetical protein
MTEKPQAADCPSQNFYISRGHRNAVIEITVFVAPGNTDVDVDLSSSKVLIDAHIGMWPANRIGQIPTFR